ncbi:MAG: OmpA family protein [Tannerella sp.]|jgi:outer membrane protein OmpA-like peptidoglycan-associated protein|nr:OmpA family protein [Tannerella sp.]
MKTKVLLLVILFGSALLVSAQEYQPQVGFSTENGSKTNFKKNKASDNIFITIAGGGNILLGDQNGDAEFSDRIAPSGAISIGKWWTPYAAVRLQLNGGLMNNFSNGGEQNFTWINPHLDLMWDVTNFWAPYKESKVFHFIPFAGIGYGFRPEKTVDGIKYGKAEAVSTNLGAQLLFRLSKRVDLVLEGQYTLLGDHWNWDFHARPRYDRPVQAMLGLNFNLGRKEFEVIEPMDYDLLNDLNSQINALRARNAELEKRPEYCPECPPQIVPEPAKESLQNVVYFRLNSAKIDKNQEINIFNTAEYSKKHSLPIKLVGYADKKTGNPDYNKGLSERRARAVAKQLTEKYGISSNNISIEWKGDTVQPYAENAWNRVVIMDTKED